MKTLYAMCLLMLGLCSQAATAAPVGWYELDATWRDGQFSGRFYYDGASPYRITEVDGTLVDIAQTTAIDRVWNLDNAQPEAWIYLSNTNPADLGGHDAGFYLYLLDLGSTLGLDTSVSNGLYDWSSDFAFYNPGQLDDSPLLSYRIAEAGVADVPLPGTALLCLAGGLAMLPRRRRQAGR